MLLIRAVQTRLGPDAIRFGWALTGFETGDTGTTAHFRTPDGGASFHADVLAGCDGIHSAVRRRFFPDEGLPKWNGVSLFRSTVRTGKATVVRPPTPGQGARRVWSDSKGTIWVSEWNVGEVGRYDPATRKWREWRVPGAAQIYAVYIDDKDVVWLTDFGRSGIWRFAPATGRFTRVPLRAGANVRQLLGRPGEVWGAESGTDRLVVVRG